MEGAKKCIDTCGTLAGRRLKCTLTETTELFQGGGSYKTESLVESEVIRSRGGKRDTVRTRLLSWERSESNRFGVPSWSSPEVQGRKDGLRIYGWETWGSPLLAHFVRKKGRLELAPGFRKRLVSGLTKPDDTALRDGKFLGSMVESADWNADASILQVLELHAIKDSLRRGSIDEALSSLERIVMEPADAFIS